MTNQELETEILKQLYITFGGHSRNEIAASRMEIIAKDYAKAKVKEIAVKPSVIGRSELLIDFNNELSRPGNILTEQTKIKWNELLAKSINSRTLKTINNFKVFTFKQ